jgi:DNA processing protein
MAQFGSAKAVLEATSEQLQQVQGVGAKLAHAIVHATTHVDVQAEIANCRKHDIAIVTLDDGDYPRSLLEIYDPPYALFTKGRIRSQDALSIAIVGTRHATQYGKRVAERLSSALSRAGLTIVSGLARGIDGVAHRAALASGGRTLAVLAGGVLNVYPAEHLKLAEEITAAGALVSEFPSRWPISKGAFPRRNRLITGLSLGVIVIEAGLKSGALTSARHAMEQGREVFAVPGPIDSRMSQGCHALLRDGATLVESADDVLEALGPLVEASPREDGTTIHHPAELQLNTQEQRVLQAIETQPTSIEQVVVATGIPIPNVLATISVLEMRRLVRRVSGQLVCRM